MNDVFTFLKNRVATLLTEEANNWVDDKIKSLTGDFENKEFYLTFSMAPRYVGKAPFQVNEEDLKKAWEAREGFQPVNWTTDQAVRSLFLITIGKAKEDKFFNCLTQLHEHADVRESVAIYASLPLLPYPEKLQSLASEGVRTNMQLVFDAIALNNPYPADHLDESAWNQMVLKAVFMQRPLYRVYGIDERANGQLARMLVDFAHERWAAGRKVVPELWRLVGPFINENNFQDIEKLMSSEDPLEKHAGLLACHDSKFPKAKKLLEQNPDIKSSIESGKLNWDMIGEKFYYEEINQQ